MTPAATTGGVCPNCPSWPTSSAWGAERGREAAGCGSGSGLGAGLGLRLRLHGCGGGRHGRFGLRGRLTGAGCAAVRAEARAVLQPLAALVAERHPGREPSRTFGGGGSGPILAGGGA